MSKKIVKLAFVGVGGMGQMAHLRNYASLPGECEIIALAEVRPELGRRVAARYGVPKVYVNHEELLANEKPDAIVAAQPFERHGILVPELARAGVPLFTEKPIANSLAAGERIVKALEENRTWLMVGYHKRSDPAAEYVKKTVEALKQSGELGKLRYVRVIMPAGDWQAGGFNDLLHSSEKSAIPLAPFEPPDADMDEPTYRQYNSFVNYYIHQVNLLRFLLGEDYAVSHADPSGVLLVARGKSGVTGVIEMSPYQTKLDWHEAALVAFERGYVKLHLPPPLASLRAGTVEILRSPADGEQVLLSPTMPPVHAMRNQALNFIKAVRGEAPAPCLAPEALADIKIARDYIRLLKGN